jgi:Kef-type K+ transport system membrane component KefB
MEENAYFTAIAAGTFYLIASYRLTRLSRRTGERPELLLGLYFAFSGLYYLGYNIPSVLGVDPWPPAIEIAIEWVYIVGVLPYLFFIRLVFRPDDAWAGWVVGACSAFLLVGIAMQTAAGRVDLGLDDPWFLLEWVGYTTPCVWMGWEAMLYRRGAKKRARIGLCPPIVANRYLLLALFGGFQTLACVADLYWAHDKKFSEAVSMISDALLGGAEIASVTLLWLAFFPPRIYENWITRRAVILPTPMEG